MSWLKTRAYKRSDIYKAQQANKDEEWQQFLWEMEVVLSWLWGKSALFADDRESKAPTVGIQDLLMAIRSPAIRSCWIGNVQDDIWFRGQDARRLFLAARKKQGLSPSGVRRFSMEDGQVIQDMDPE